MEKLKLKGGSLSGTYLIDVGGKKIVRKEVSLTENREYGFQRWYSQLKRLQRYSVLFNGIFPNIINIGKDGDVSYFDMDYIVDSVPANEYIYNASEEEVDLFFEELLLTMDKLYSYKIPSSVDSMRLYLNEEIHQRLNDSYLNDDFVKFVNNDYLIFNGEKIPSFVSRLGEYEKLAIDCYKNPTETFTHGNLTLENILYVPSKNLIYFIDPYEENIIDSKLSEYSQLLQSSNSYYEIYNNTIPKIEGNVINLEVDIPEGLKYFNNKLINYIKSNYSNNDIITIKVFEISQFIRMIPFKSVVDVDKMFFFYGLASKLLNDLLVEVTDYNEKNKNF